MKERIVKILRGFCFGLSHALILGVAHAMMRAGFIRLSLLLYLAFLVNFLAVIECMEEDRDGDKS